MTAFTKAMNRMQTATRSGIQAFFKFSHNGFALLGLILVFFVIGLVAQPDLRRNLELKMTAWLQERQFTLLGMEIRPAAVSRATAMDPADLPKEQADVAYWLSRKYRVAPEPVGALVAEAYRISDKTSVEPTLMLAIMAVESSFNPFAQSSVGAQGLMQVMTRVHVDKYESFGGSHAAFDPVTNLRVGVRVLQDCIQRRGSVEGGLRCYVGATSTISDGGYVNKVMAEFSRLQQVAEGKAVPHSTPLQLAIATPVASPAAATAVTPAPETAIITAPVVAPAPTPVTKPGNSLTPGISPATPEALTKSPTVRPIAPTLATATATAPETENAHLVAKATATKTSKPSAPATLKLVAQKNPPAKPVLASTAKNTTNMPEGFGTFLPPSLDKASKVDGSGQRLASSSTAS